MVAAAAACSSSSSGGFGQSGNGGNLTSSGGASSDDGTSSGTTPGDDGTTGPSSSGTSDDSNPSSSGTASGASSSGGRTTIFGDASVSDADVDQPITLTMDSFTVTPQLPEVYKCQQFGNPFGHDVDIVKMVGTMSAGSHHFFLFNMAPYTARNTTAPLGDCPGAGLEFHPFPYLSQTPGAYTVEYGAGFGYPLVGQNGLMMNVHYLNTSGEAITPKISITIYPGKPGTVTTHVGTIFLNNISISVPAFTTNPIPITSNNTPIVDEDYTIFTNWSHMHQYAVDFTASTSAGQFYEEKDWSEPPLITSGSGAAGTHTSANLPMQMAKGTNITWTCMYTNPTAQAMTFGDSAQTQNMCIYLGQYYPADNQATNPNYPDIINAVNL
jgi:hypothetical protein